MGTDDTEGGIVHEILILDDEEIVVDDFFILDNLSLLDWLYMSLLMQEE